jgi:hypothetical protein
MADPTQSSSVFSVDQRPQKRDKVKNKVKQLFRKMGATSSPSPSQAISSGIPTRSEKIKDRAGVLWSGIETSLKLLKECSDWNPILKSVVGGVVACIDLVGVCIFSHFVDIRFIERPSLYQKVSQNQKDIADLTDRLGGVALMLKENAEHTLSSEAARDMNEFLMYGVSFF